MARKSKQQLGIAPKMYRHFAASTLAVSGVFAFLASGEAQQVVAHSDIPVVPQSTKQTDLVASKPVNQRIGAIGRGATDGLQVGTARSLSIDDGDVVIPAEPRVKRAAVMLEVH